MEEDQGKPTYILNERNILDWDKPLKPGYFRMMDLKEFDGSTEILDYLGFDSLDFENEEFRISGSATKYLAKIAPWTGSYKSKKDAPSEEVKESVLFSGGLQIYRKGDISGTEFKGYELERVGEIWIARLSRSRFRNENGLWNLIFENAHEDKSKRIEEVVRGYEYQERKKRDAEFKNEHAHYQSGLMQGKSGRPGIFD